MARIMEVWPELFLEKEGGGGFFLWRCVENNFYQRGFFYKYWLANN